MGIVLFDLDGTLTDPLAGTAAALDRAMVGLGRDPLSAAQHRAAVGPPLQDVFADLGLTPGQVDTAATLYREYYRDRGLLENQVYPGIPEALAQLRATGLRLAVATSKPERFAVRIVEHFGLDAHLEHVAGASLDGSVRTKADVVALALAALGAPTVDRVTMVGDRAHDVHGAAAHGIRCLGVAWGYGEPGELFDAGAFAVAQSPAELLEYLR